MKTTYSLSKTFFKPYHQMIFFSDTITALKTLKKQEVLYAEEDCSKHTSHSHNNGYGLTIHSNPRNGGKYFVSAFLGLIYALV